MWSQIDGQGSMSDRIFSKFIYKDEKGEHELVVLESAVRQEITSIHGTRPYITENQIMEAMSDLEYWLCRMDNFDYWEDDEEAGPLDRIAYNPKTGTYECPNIYDQLWTIPKLTFSAEIELVMDQYNLDREEAQSLVVTTDYWMKRYLKAHNELGNINWDMFIDLTSRGYVT